MIYFAMGIYFSSQEKFWLDIDIDKQIVLKVGYSFCQRFRIPLLSLNEIDDKL